VGPRAGLDKEDRGKILCPRRGSNPYYYYYYYYSMALQFLQKFCRLFEAA
jgi:hypothetical protein